MSWFRRATGSAPKPAPPQNGVVGGSRPPNPFLQGAGDGASAEQQLALRNLQMMLYKFKSLPTEREKAAALRPLLQLFASIYEAADAYVLINVTLFLWVSTSLNIVGFVLWCLFFFASVGVGA